MQRKKAEIYERITDFCITPKEIKDIAAVLKVNESTTREYIRALIKDGRITRIALNGKDGVYKTSEE